MKQFPTFCIGIFALLGFASAVAADTPLRRTADPSALYASGQAAPGAITERVTELSRLQAEFRYAYLSAHLAMRTILTSDQVAWYDEMRGYTAVSATSPPMEAAPAHQHMHH